MPHTTRPEVAAMQPYVPGKPIQAVRRELGLTDVVKLASNENPLGPSPAAMAAARDALADAHLYPEPTAPDLQQALAQQFRLPPDWVFIGNGSDEIFRLLAETYLQPGDRVVVPAPSFSVYTSVAALMGAQAEAVPLAADGGMDLPAMAQAAAGGGRARLVFLCRPNNPTGGVFAPHAFTAFMAAVPAQTLVVLDEAYKEFDPSPFQGRDWLDRYPNLVVTRTFSKAYGLAGLRLGYGLGRPDAWRPLYTVRDPFSVNLVAQAAGRAALADTGHLTRSIELAAAGRAFLAELAGSLGLRVYPSAANFVLIDLGRDAGAVAAALLQRGLIVRPCGSFGLPTCIRITCGLPEQNQRLADALRAVLA